jgi:poly(A) polymerase
MRKAARRIVEKLRLHGHEAFFAGGWVRDFLLRRKPKDIDIATSALPDDVLRLFPNSKSFGAQFGVIRVPIYGRTFEVTTFRSDSTYLDGRHPSSVTFSGPEQDALRRDFTINGLFYDPIADRLIDYVHGRSDLQAKRIRTIGNPEERFSEDKLRMLRAIRFACILGFEIVPETWDAIQKLAPGILQISWERIRDELSKILTGPDPASGLDLLHQSHLLTHVLPEIEALCGMPRDTDPDSKAAVFTLTLRAMGILKKPSTSLAFGTLFHDLRAGVSPEDEGQCENIHAEHGAKIASQICRRLKMSNEEISRIVDLVSTHPEFSRARQMQESALKKLMRKPNIADHLELYRVACLSNEKSLDTYRYCLQKFKEYSQEPVAAPLITGEDLIEMGYAPGPVFKRILQTVEELQLEGVLRTRNEALDHVKSAFPSLHQNNQDSED